MKILLLDSEYLEYEAKKKAIDNPEELKKEKDKIEDCLTVFACAEKGDSTGISKKAVKEIKDACSQIGKKRIVLYPWVHLSSNPSSPKKAMKIFSQIKKDLEKEDFEVHKSPFGWYKAFNISVKGHPLAELSREIKESKEEKEREVESYDYKELLREISKTTLDREKLEENDHRILGRDLDLFSFNEVAPGMVFWHEKGLFIKNQLINYWRELHRKENYKEIETPQILDKKLWQISGHWEKYKENIFLTEYEDREFAVKPMNCPGGLLIFKNSQKSYNDLPLKVGELGTVHRQELSGVLSGLFRVIKFTQDDAHIYCTKEQLEDEIMKVVKLADTIYKQFDMDYHIELSTRPKKRIGSDEIWDKAEDALKTVLDKNKIDYKINKGDGAFYGPKIDFHLKDSMDRTWQCGTVQVDFSMPERFDLSYIGEDGKKHRPVMVHRALFGSLERFIGILLEHYKGNLPLWLSPNQVVVMTLTDENKEYGKKIYKKLKEKGIRVKLDDRAETMNKKVRDEQVQKYNYMITVGDKEEKKKTIAVRNRDGDVDFGVDPDEFIEDIKEEIQKRK